MAAFGVEPFKGIAVVRPMHSLSALKFFPWIAIKRNPGSNARVIPAANIEIFTGCGYVGRDNSGTRQHAGMVEVLIL
jgi:hypothetical protein